MPHRSPPATAAAAPGHAVEPVTPRRVPRHDASRVVPTAAGGRLPRRQPPLIPAVARPKVRPVPVRDDTLSRTRLLDWLRERIPVRVKLISAEAGYGKTTLLADFSRRRWVRCLWYKLDAGDRDWTTFVSTLVASVREEVPAFGHATAGLLAQSGGMGSPRETILKALTADIADLDDVPTMLILDDFHLVDDSEDVQTVMAQLIRDAPPTVTFLVSSRRRPPMALGRLAAQGELAELTTSDLRFSRAETEALFSDAYKQPLEADLIAEVDARTEGWAASLQLLHSSIRQRRPSEVRRFIGSLSGAEGSLYDFLAEEVLAHLSADLQRFVVHASLLDRIVPEYVVAALSADESDAPTLEDVRRWIAEADALGVLARSSAESGGERFHPLLGDFLRRQLDLRTTPAERRAMHARVARAAERSDWLAACHHYIEAGEDAEAMRVLSSSVGVALASGQFDAAATLIRRLGVALSPGAAIIRARDLIREGDAVAGVAELRGIRPDDLSPELHSIARQAEISGLFRLGRTEELLACVDATVSDDSMTVETREMAEVLAASVCGVNVALPALARRLADLADRQRRAGQPFYSAVSYHNAMNAYIAQGRYDEALRLGEAAVAQYSRVGAAATEVYSTHAAMALCALELGLNERGREEVAEATAAVELADGDALAETAYLEAVMGRWRRAEALADAAEKRMSLGRQDLGSGWSLVAARAMSLIVAGQPSAAAEAVRDLPSEFEGDYASVLAALPVASVARALAGEDIADRLRELLTATQRAGARRATVRLRVILMAVESDADGLRAAVEEAARSGALALLETADLIASSLNLLEPITDEVKTSVLDWPDRWLPLLRREIAGGNTAAAHAAARLLALTGELVDVPRLRAFERTYMRRSRTPSLARELAVRKSPRLVVRDLGRMELAVGSRVVAITDMRRKAAALLTFVCTRPRMTATKEQVVDALWPDLDPDSAANSLNQTLYFLRRDIDPWYEDGVSADYLRYEGELLWLAPELVSVQSAEFRQHATEALNGRDIATAMSQAIGRYSGRFAPEFEYDEWSIAWRDHLHATFLAVARQAVLHHLAAGDVVKAHETCMQVLAIDPEALDVERDLIWIYGRLGATSAAAEQYEHYARSVRGDIGIEPPPLRQLLDEAPAHGL
jgi:ATP/maltotriose-dependent transcriptional regulator MalT/DNA-binding SARP family transcriptional activator